MGKHQLSIGNTDTLYKFYKEFYPKLEEAKGATISFLCNELNESEVDIWHGRMATRCKSVLHSELEFNSRTVKGVVYARDREDWIGGMSILRSDPPKDEPTEIVWPWLEEDYLEKKLHAYLILSALNYSKKVLNEEKIIVIYDQKYDGVFIEDQLKDSEEHMGLLSQYNRDSERSQRYLKWRFSIMKSIFENIFKLRIDIRRLRRGETSFICKIYEFDLRKFPVPDYL